MTYDVVLKVFITMMILNLIVNFTGVFLFFRGNERLKRIKHLIKEYIVATPIAIIMLIGLYLVMTKQQLN